MMGTGPFAVPTFQSLLSSDHQVTCLVTKPDRPVRGRKKLPANPLREVAEAHALPVFAPESINAAEGLKLLDERQAELFVVCDYGQILSAEALGKASLGGINLHGSLLPKYRGAAPIQWALLHGDSRAGITVIHMSTRLDGGPMLTQRAVDVGRDEDAVQLERRLAELGVEAVLTSIEMLAAWDGSSPVGEVQSPDFVSKAPRLKKSDGNVDWRRSAEQIFNQVRALKPWPGTFTHLLRDGKSPLRLILESVYVADAALDLPIGSAKSTDAGTIFVKCGDGILGIERLQPAGKRSMASAEFRRGYGAPVMVFGKPREVDGVR